MINPIKFLKSIYYANRPLYSNSKSMVKMSAGMNEGLQSKINAQMSGLERAAETIGKPVTIVPKGDKAALMNFGTYTTVYRHDDLQNQIAERMYEHINKVAKTAK